uniref:M28 family metallopeptidase n=1 Tax=uncultured Draconibacterium sp. TaxID=1573823 RepID=UPI0032179920
MKKSFLLLFIIVSGLLVTAQDINYAKDVVKTLSSPEFKGRGYVGNGDKIAAKYIREQFLKLGLQPFNNDYFQPFEVDVNTFPSKMELRIDGEELIPGVDYMVDRNSASLKGKFPVLVVEEEDLFDEKKLKSIISSSAGKVLIIKETESENSSGENKNKRNELLKYIKFDPEVPSVATIILTTKKLLWRGLTYQDKKLAFTVKKDLDLENIKEVSINVKAKFIKYETRNVVGYFEGTEKPDSFLVMTGHYDHLGKMGAKTYFPGANDNASGIAMMLNLAQYYKENPPKYSIAFMALAAEEIGILGAAHYAENPLFDLGKIRFLVNFDMAGTGDDGIKVVNGSVFQNEFDLLSRINTENDYLPSVNIRGAACNSDHCKFYEKGVPSFFIYTLGGTQAYHDLNDRFEYLPFTEFVDYTNLMINFFDSF